MANPLAYMLNRAGSNEASTRNLYAQLQAPKQRAASLKVMNEAVAKGAPTINDVIDPFTNQSIGTSIKYNKAASYEDARRAADVAAYSVTIDPTQLARGIGSNVSPSNIANAYINPVAEGAYDTTPQFDWMGRQVAGAGSRSPKPTRTDSMMYDLSYGRDKQAAQYQDAINKTISNAQYQEGVTRDALEQQRFPAYSNATKPLYENQYTLLDYDTHHNDPDYYTNLARAQGAGIPHGAGLWPMNGMWPQSYFPSPEMQQAAMLQASQTKMSESFYGRGGHDNPTSFPAGYRL